MGWSVGGARWARCSGTPWTRMWDYHPESYCTCLLVCGFVEIVCARSVCRRVLCVRSVRCDRAWRGGCALTVERDLGPPVRPAGFEYEVRASARIEIQLQLANEFFLSAQVTGHSTVTPTKRVPGHTRAQTAISSSSSSAADASAAASPASRIASSSTSKIRVDFGGIMDLPASP